MQEKMKNAVTGGWAGTGSLGSEMGRGMRERVRRLDRPLPSLPASDVGVVTVFVPSTQKYSANSAEWQTVVICQII